MSSVLWEKECGLARRDGAFHAAFRKADYSRVDYMRPEAVQVLIKLLNRDTFLMDGPTTVRNMLHAAGFASHVLD